MVLKDRTRVERDVIADLRRIELEEQAGADVAAATDAAAKEAMKLGRSQTARSCPLIGSSARFAGNSPIKVHRFTHDNT